MNLEFADVREISREENGKPREYMLQKADVTRAPDFWRNWRGAKEALKKLIHLQLESGRWIAYRLQPKVNGEPYGKLEVPYCVKRTDKLLPYQPKSVAAIVKSIIQYGSAADGSDTGTGKTYVALGACRELRLKPLIICKKAGLSAWQRACRYLEIEPAYIVNWELAKTGRLPFVRRCKKEFAKGYNFTWVLPQGTLLIFDEAHMGNHHGSQNYDLWTSSVGHASLSMSATFADKPTRLRGLFKVLHVMDDKQFDSWLISLGHFINQYNELESIASTDDMKSVNKILYPKHGFRISYEDPDVKKFFPQAVIQTHVVDIGEKETKEQNEAYQSMLRKAKEYKDMGKQADFLVADLRYRQCAELLKADALAELAKEYLYEGRSVCIFVNFRETLAYLAKALLTRSMIFGNQDTYSDCKREDVIRRFQSSEERIILCMVEAGGTSIDLHDLKGGRQRISLICPTYNPVTLQQVLGRTRRAGSKTIPIMKLVYAAGTVEEKVAETVNRKLDNIAALNDGDLMEPDLFGLRNTQ